MARKIQTTCSGCMNDVTLNLVARTATTHVPHNGARGLARVPAHDETVDIVVTDQYGDDLLMWECGECGYADSYDMTA